MAKEYTINGKKVKGWYTRGGARIPIYEDGSIGRNQNKKYTIKDIQKIADKEGKLPSEIQDRLGLSDKDLGLKDEYTEKFEEEMQSMKRYLKAEEAKNKTMSERVREIDNKTIKSIKTQKSLKQLAENGSATDITRLSDKETRALADKHGRLERTKVIYGTYGMNGALLRSNKTGEYFVITARNSNIFYWV